MAHTYKANIRELLTNVAQNVKNVASKNIKKPKVAENLKSCRKVAEQLLAKPSHGMLPFCVQIQKVTKRFVIAWICKSCKVKFEI